MYHSMQVHYYIFMLSNYTIKMQFKRVLHPEMPDVLFFIIKMLLQFKFQRCAYTQLEKKKLEKKNSQGGGGATLPKVPN